MAKLIKGVNDLSTVNPELAKQWHHIKNGNLKPTDVTAGSHQKVWWLYPYDDPKTGKHFDFEWQATIKSRHFGNNCPYLSGQAVWPGFNDLLTTNPKLAAEWHPTKNGKLTPQNVTANNGKNVWWYLPYDDPKTGKHFDFEWQAKIQNRNNGHSCPFLSGRTAWPNYNDLATVNPKLAAEWHPTKNGKLTPQNVTANSPKKFWWLYSYDDPKTGKHFDFEWQANILNRSNGSNCPFLGGKAVWPGYNDLATINPSLAAEWHPTKNGNLTPQNVTANSSKKAWWLLHYTDPITKKSYNYEWKSTINNRSRGEGCPYISTPKTIQLIQSLLKTKNINFVGEKIFSDLKNILPLRFDIFVNNKYMIEIDGFQHFESVNYFGGKKEFKQRIHHDNLKNEYCYNNNIPLLRIPYIYDSVTDKEKIEQFVLDFITTGKVPQEIIDFYSQYKFSNYTSCIFSKNLSSTA